MSQRRIHVIQHVAFEDAANVGVWARSKNYPVHTTRLFAAEPLPTVDQFDWLVIMGGPMNIYEEERYPWLVEEKQLLRKAIDNGKTLIGICLGAQLLADALGGSVTRNEETEIGWSTVEPTPEATQCKLWNGLEQPLTVFQWHGDTFDIPPGAIHLARSEACRNQAFLYEGRVLGLQFHLDYSADSIHAMLEHCGDELVEGRYIQTEEEIIDRLHDTVALQQSLYRILDNLD